MTKPFDSDEIAKLGWRQGAVLGTELAKIASKRAPETVVVDDADWLIVTSHDCDFFSFRSPIGVVRYRCRELRGLSGIVISSRPAFSSGRTTWSLNLVRSVRPQVRIRSAMEQGSVAFTST